MNRRISFRRGPVAISRTGKGFSLIEILVVLVILLIGILAILRLFPGGFLTIVRTAEMTAAQALVDQQTNNRRNQTISVVAYLAGLPNVNGDIVPINGIRPDDLTDVSAADLTNIYTQYGMQPVPGYNPYYFSNINKLRYVIGETVHIPIASPATIASVGGTIYTLQYGPVFNIIQSNGSAYKDSIHVYGNNMNPVQQDSTTVQGANLAAALPDASYYAIDYANNMIAFVPRAANGRAAPYRLYRFTATTYRVDQGTGNLITDRTTIKMNVTIQVNDDASGANPPLPVWQPIKLTDCNGNDITATAHIWPGTDQVSRQFRLVTGGNGPKAGSFSDDPYEYYWYSGQMPNSQNANLGTLIFNPLAHVVNPGDGTAPTTDPADKLTLDNNNNLVVHIDYLTFDNHIIRDDRNVPAAFPFAVHLSLAYIATTGDIQADQSTYNGMFSEASSGATPDVIVYNMATGAIVSQIPSAPGTDVVPAAIDAKTGLLTLGDPTQNGADVVKAGLQSAALRVFYRTQKEYGMQVQQASAQYLPVSDPACLDYESFYVGGGAAGGAANKLYFDVSQAGKTINIGEYYTGPTTSPADRHTNMTYKISDVSDPNGLESIPGKGTYVWVQLSGNLTSAATGRAVNNVQGASLKSRVIWIGSTEVNNGGTPNPVILKRWRKVDNDTVLQATN